MLTNLPLDRLVGVIDLKHGQAVHAVAGHREHYHPVGFCDGDPVRLARHYLQLGIQHIYVADLDAIADRGTSLSSLEQLVESVDEISKSTVRWIVDAGQGIERASSTRSLASDNVRWVAATEWLKSVSDLKEYSHALGVHRMVLGIDFRAGELLGEEPDLMVWFQRASDLAIESVIVLDFDTVGTAKGPSMGAICRQVRAGLPNVTLYSGGGIRDEEDLNRLHENGCNFFLVATSLYPVSE